MSWGKNNAICSLNCVKHATHATMFSEWWYQFFIFNLKKQDSCKVPMHKPGGSKFACRWRCARNSRWPLGNGANFHQSRETKILCDKLLRLQYSFRYSLQWRHNGGDGVSLTIVYSTVYSGADKKTAKPRVTAFCVGNSPVTGEPPHKGPVTRKMLPFDDVSVFYLITQVIT